MREIKGNLFEQEVNAIVITTNGFVKTDGKAVMGAGVAKQARDIYSGIDKMLGSRIKEYGNHVFVLTDQIPFVVSFPVKHVWNEPADLQLIERSCQELVTLTSKKGWKSVVIPKPGCGSGKRNWEKEVKLICGKYFDDRFLVIDR